MKLFKKLDVKLVAFMKEFGTLNGATKTIILAPIWIPLVVSFIIAVS